MKVKKLKQVAPVEDKSNFLSALIRVGSRTEKALSAGAWRLIAFAAVIISGGCGGAQSALDAAGVQASRLENLWWIFFSVTATVYVIVMAVLLAALARRRRGDENTAPDLAPDERRETRIGNTVKAAVAVTTVILFALMIVSFRTGRAIQTLSGSPQPLQIKVTGHQWWWEIEYQDAVPSNNVTTANELHLPAGRPVKLVLQSNDVIHSFWLPNLHGKKDLIPNYPTAFYFQAEKTGTFWGQCAEYCGYQHAKMRFMVTVEAPEDFDAWISAQRQTSAAPATDAQKRGQQIFLTGTCTQCHTVQGTIAGGRVGPNLTHVASRPYIGAGSLPKTREHLQNWITDPQKIKPGIRMPMSNYAPEDLQDLVEYLESLK
ncbi:MAG TPA: cytochrome c oxidase subunit II [Pyrinomonadaceae bacterium]|jgi:cytochrome c oxidase subunit 2